MKQNIQHPFISIIIPVYNPNYNLDKCLESIHKQEFKNYEILIIQRVNSLKTIPILNTKKLNFPFKCITTLEVGIYKAMNIGVIEASGKWFLFLGQDDQLANNLTFSEVFEKLKHIDKGIALGKVKIIDKKSILTPSNYQNKISPMIFFKNTLHHQGILYHSEIFNKIKFDENLSVLADYKLSLELIKSKIDVSYLDLQISISKGSGISKTFTKQLYTEEKKIKKELLTTSIYYVVLLFILIKQFVKINFGNSTNHLI